MRLPSRCAARELLSLSAGHFRRMEMQITSITTEVLALHATVTASFQTMKAKSANVLSHLGIHVTQTEAQAPVTDAGEGMTMTAELNQTRRGSATAAGTSAVTAVLRLTNLLTPSSNGLRSKSARMHKEMITTHRGTRWQF